ncbi:MAG: YkgJ family cysteine cluster protein [Planctomycetota bacterium]
MAHRHGSTREWFDHPDPDTGKAGLSFGCTQCGNCCTGPPGYVGFTAAEAEAIAKRLGLSHDDFIERYTHDTRAGRSINEHKTEHGYDCVFLDRTTIPGKAVCGIYEDRPAQCRAWPFWTSTIRSRRDWNNAGQTCPGIGRGTHYKPQQIRVIRATEGESEPARA